MNLFVLLLKRVALFQRQLELCSDYVLLYLFEYLEYLEYSVLKIVTIKFRMCHGSKVSFMYSMEKWVLRTEGKL